MKKAVTLFEFIIVFAIIGIIAAITIPTTRNYLPSWQLSGSARALVGQLRQAQEEAVTVQKQHAIRFTSLTSPVTYQLIKIDSGETILEETQMPTNISVSLDSSFTGNQVIFSADGGPSASGNIGITLEDATKTINITPAGVIKL